GDFADTVAGYVDEVKKLADAKRDEAAARARLLAAGAYRLADDPTISRGDPAPLAASPRLDFAPLDGATARLKASAAAFDKALAATAASLTPAQKKKLDAALLPQEQRLLRDKGLPFRPWYKNMVYAPGRFTGYGAKTLPGVREAIEERRFDDATAYIGLTAQAPTDYSARLDAATPVIHRRPAPPRRRPRPPRPAVRRGAGRGRLAKCGAAAGGPPAPADGPGAPVHRLRRPPPDRARIPGGRSVAGRRAHRPPLRPLPAALPRAHRRR